MIFASKKVTLKNGISAELRTPEISDAEKLLRYIIQSCGETEFLLRYPEERSGMTVEQEEKWIEKMRSSPDKLGIGCYIDGEVAGLCELNFKVGIKTSHRAIVSIAILKAYWGMGIGSVMFEEMIAAAREHGTEIMELEVVEGNERAVKLYEKFGFKTVSEKPNALKLKDGRYLSEFYMQKYLK